MTSGAHKTTVKSIVLLSSGLDSTVNLLAARAEGAVLKAITFDYGQKAAVREIAQSQKICEKYGIDHQIVGLPFFKDFTKTSLIAQDQTIPQETEVDIHSQETSRKTADRVWVPNRNGIFLNVAAGFAEGLGADVVVPGFNLEEAQTFADNSKAYLEVLNDSFSYSTLRKISVKCYTTDLNKTEIVKLGLSLGLDIHDLWPCYFGGAQWCGQCESCLRFKNALSQAGIAL
jgi:7-cyano-7-deazaguanine synthase